VPVVSLADTDFLSSSPVAWMPWLKRDPAELMPYPSCVPNFNEALAEAGRDPVDSAVELLWGDATIVASCPELEPPPQPPRGRRPPIYAGPLYWDPAGSNGEPPPANGHRRVYVTLGSGSMVGRELLQRVLDALDGPELQVYVSVGLHPDGELSPPANARVDGFTGLTRALRWSDVVLSHGGYSTVVAASALARPQVVLPLMSEQETNGREMVERVGTGLLVRKTVDDPAARRLGFVHRRSGPAASPLPSADDVRSTVDAVLGDERYRASSAAMAERLAAARESFDAVAAFDAVAG